jgi:hypothetical protein
VDVVDDPAVSCFERISEIGSPLRLALLVRADQCGSFTSREIADELPLLGYDVLMQNVPREANALVGVDLLESIDPAASRNQRFGITDKGCELLELLRSGGRLVPPLRVLAIRSDSTGARRKLVAMLARDAETLYECDGDFDAVAIYRDDLPLVRDLRDRLRAAGARTHEARLSERAD